MGRLQLRALLLATLWLPAPATSAASAATEEGGDSVLPFVQALLMRQASRSAETATELAAALQDKLHQRKPSVGRSAALFDRGMAKPLLLPTHLAAFNAAIVAPPTSRWRSVLAMTDAQWRRQFGSLGGEREGPPPQEDPNAACEIQADERIDAPTTLAEAVDDVRRLAEAVVRRQRQATERRTRGRLAKTYAGALDLLSSGFSTSLSASERRRLRRLLARLDSADMAGVLCAARVWAQLLHPAWLTPLRQLMHGHANAAVIQRVATPYGEIVIGGRYDARLHLENVLFLADLGGDDFYGLEDRADFGGEPQLIVDFDGDDRYQSSRPAGYAAGVGRVAIVLDMAGDDVYLGETHSQGSAVLGVGALLDLAGNDSYRAQSFGQGAALFGIGLLFDGGGTDRYHIRANGQGLGMAEGLGLLLEAEGDDRYAAVGGPPTNYGTPGLMDAWAQGVSRGVRGIAPGGIGALVDRQGADRYDGGGFAQGGAYYWGVGQLLDLGHEDDDLLGSRYSAGWAAHGGIGHHFNEGGDDRYRSRHIVGAGIAWDYGLALFVDAAGDDFYRFGGLGLGAAAHHSASWFVDAAGADRYVDVGPLARADIEPPNLALFMDAGDAGNRLNGRPAPTACEQRSSEWGTTLWGAGNGESCADEAAATP